MTDANPPRLGQGPNLDREPLRTGNPSDTHEDRERVRFTPPTWAVDRMSAGVLMLVLVAILIVVGVLVIRFLLGFDRLAI